MGVGKVRNAKETDGKRIIRVSECKSKPPQKKTIHNTSQKKQQKKKRGIKDHPFINGGGWGVRGERKKSHKYAKGVFTKRKTDSTRSERYFKKDSMISRKRKDPPDTKLEAKVSENIPCEIPARELLLPLLDNAHLSGSCLDTLLMMIQTCAKTFLSFEPGFPSLDVLSHHMHVLVPSYEQPIDTNLLPYYTLYRILLLLLHMVALPITFTRLVHDCCKSKPCLTLPKALRQHAWKQTKLWLQATDRHASFEAYIGLRPKVICVIHVLHKAASLVGWRRMIRNLSHFPMGLEQEMIHLIHAGYFGTHQLIEILPIRYRNLIDHVFGFPGKKNFPTFSQLRECKKKTELLQSIPAAARDLHCLAFLEFSLYVKFREDWLNHREESLPLIFSHFGHRLRPGVHVTES